MASETDFSHSLPEALPDYEARLLQALAFFLGRDASSQARACLCMYLRQSEPRIMAQLKYYAHRLSQQTGESVNAYVLLDWIAQDPEAVAARLEGPGVHTNQPPDIFD